MRVLNDKMIRDMGRDGGEAQRMPKPCVTKVLRSVVGNCNERDAIQPGSALPKKRGSLGFSADRHGDEQQQWRKHDEQKQRTNDVDGSLQLSARQPAGSALQPIVEILVKGRKKVERHRQ